MYFQITSPIPNYVNTSQELRYEVSCDVLSFNNISQQMSFVIKDYTSDYTIFKVLMEWLKSGSIIDVM